METGRPVLLPSDPGLVLIATGDRYPRHNLPAQPTPLIGREEELTRLSTLLAEGQIRLVTLTGPGGVGKTRLAVAAAESVCEHFPNGVWFVDLTPLTDPVLVMPTIGRVVGSCEALGLDRRDSLVAFLQERASLLLLDNFEHLLAAVPDIESVLAACPSITILTTSREPLHLRREHVVEVHPLPVPSTRRPAWTVEDLETVPAVTLFVARAQAAEAGFRLTTSNAACVAELSCRLDGLPLAVELAAVRTRLMGLAALVARVEQGLELLRWDTADLPLRHRTLLATLDWSYDLLCPEEQLVFRRLGVFAGGFTLEAVAAVAVTDKLGAEPLDVPSPGRQAPGRGDHECGAGATLRAAGHDARICAVAVGGERRSRADGDRHLIHYLALAEQADGAMRGPDEAAWLNRLDHEVDNLRQAQAWAIARGDANAEWRFVAALALFWVFRGYLREGMERIEVARSRAYEADPALRARFLADWSGDDARAIAHYEGRLAAANAAGETDLAARVLGRLGFVAYTRGHVTRARALIAEMLALARAADSGPMIGYAYLYRVLFAIGPHGSSRERELLRGELDEPAARLRTAGFRRPWRCCWRATPAC